MDKLIEGWVDCPRCGGDLAAADGGVACQSCGTRYGQQDGVLDLVDPGQKVSSEGPGDTLPMAWRRRRWDELRGPDAPENAAYLAAIWERLRPDDRVVDLGTGPASFAAWMAEFAPELAILALDLSWPALEEAGRVVGGRPNVRLLRASTRRRLPLRDASTDVILRRLAPGLPEEVVRALAPGGHYLRFTFGPQHWREVYDLMPGLPRAREDALAGEAERLRQLGLEVEEPIHETGSEQFSMPAVLLALRSNPAAFHAERLDLKPLRQLWRTAEGARETLASLTTDYAILVARRPADAVVVPVSAPPEAVVGTPEAPASAEAPAASEAPAAPEAPAASEAPTEPEAPAAAPRRRSRAKTAAAAEPAAAELTAGQTTAELSAEAGPTTATDMPDSVGPAPAAPSADLGPAPAEASAEDSPATAEAPSAAEPAILTPIADAAPTAGEPASSEAAPAATPGEAEPATPRRRARRAQPVADGAPADAGDAEAAAPRRRARQRATTAPDAAAAAPSPDGEAAEPPRRRARRAAVEPAAPPPARRPRKVTSDAPATPRRRARQAPAEPDGETPAGPDSGPDEKPRRTRSRRPPEGDG